jgi:hypothetical protein
LLISAEIEANLDSRSPGAENFFDLGRPDTSLIGSRAG